MISDNSYLWTWKLERNKTLHITCSTWQVIAACAISKSLMTAKLLNVMNARSKSTVNSSQHCQTRRSTCHTILQYDELTVWPVDWFPWELHMNLNSVNCVNILVKSIWKVFDLQQMQCINMVHWNFEKCNFYWPTLYNFSLSTWRLQTLCQASA